MPDNEPSPASWPDIEILLKIAGGLIVALYVLGLLAINAYLFSIGAADFSLARPRFVYTGALIIAWALMCLVLPIYGFQLNKGPGFGLLIVRAITVVAGVSGLRGGVQAAEQGVWE
jgi:hypothetical protein